MKSYLLNIIVFLLVANGFAQQKSEIKPKVEDLIKNTLSNNFDKVFDETYPKIFEIVDRNQLMAVMKDAMQNDDFSITINPIDNQVELSEEKTINNAKYVLIHYNNSMSMKFNEEIEDAEAFVGLLKMSFPDGEVTYSKTTKTFDILTPSKMLAISDEATQGEWKFLNVNESDRPMMEMLIAEEVLKAFEL